MFGKRRVTRPIFGVVMETGLPVSVPAGQVIEIPIAPDAGNRTVDAVWDGKNVMMFLCDVEDRSHAVQL